MSPLRAKGLAAVPWLEHGFGTRHDGAWTPAAETARVRQVHGAEVIAVAGPGEHGDGDALATAAAGVWLEIRTADCVPVLIADPERKVVAAVHAGWRGTAARIAAVTVERLLRDWGSDPGTLLAAIGPAIGACCYAVGEEVAQHFPGHIALRDAAFHADLKGVNRTQLVQAGLAAEQIEDVGECTSCNEAWFHSFRRDRSTGRMVAAIRIVAGA